MRAWLMVACLVLAIAACESEDSGADAGAGNGAGGNAGDNGAGGSGGGQGEGEGGSAGGSDGAGGNGAGGDGAGGDGAGGAGELDCDACEQAQCQDELDGCQADANCTAAQEEFENCRRNTPSPEWGRCLDYFEGTSGDTGRALLGCIREQGDLRNAGQGPCARACHCTGAADPCGQCLGSNCCEPYLACIGDTSAMGCINAYTALVACLQGAGDAAARQACIAQFEGSGTAAAADYTGCYRDQCAEACQ